MSHGLEVEAQNAWHHKRHVILHLSFWFILLLIAIVVSTIFINRRHYNAVSNSAALQAAYRCKQYSEAVEMYAEIRSSSALTVDRVILLHGTSASCRTALQSIQSGRRFVLLDGSTSFLPQLGLMQPARWVISKELHLL